MGHERERNAVAAAHCLKVESKENGDGLASFILGLLYESGIGVDKDPIKAKFYYEQATNQGNSYGFTKIGWQYFDGYDIEKNYSKSVKYLQKGMNAGNPFSAGLLGYCYETGQGVEENKKKAFELYHKLVRKFSDFIVLFNSLNLKNNQFNI